MIQCRIIFGIPVLGATTTLSEPIYMNTKNLIKILVAALITLIASPSMIEVYLRATSTFVPPISYIFDKNVGFVFDHKLSPGTVNSFGFVDKARNPGDTSKTRIIIVGDSFVSGTSLASNIEKELNAQFPGHQFEVIPMAFPGIGLGNMYSFVKQYGLQFHPSAVVAVFNSSTFANNSSILEAMKLRGHPDHPMRLFFDVKDGECSEVPIDPDFEKYTLKELPLVRPRTLYTVIEDNLERLLGHSYAFNWLKDIISQGDEHGFLREDKEFAYRYYQLASMPRIRKMLNGWSFPDDLDVNSMFWTATDTMPSVFINALDDTKCALLAFDDLAHLNNFKFMLAISDDCTFPNELMMREFKFRSQHTKRIFIEQECKNKIVALAKETKTHFIDLYEQFSGKSLALHYFNDIHWNEDGIKTAANGISNSIASEFEKDLSSKTF